MDILKQRYLELLRHGESTARNGYPQVRAIGYNIVVLRTDAFIWFVVVVTVVKKFTYLIGIYLMHT